MTIPTILVLHGMTMNGSSMVRTLGQLGDGLKESGFELTAPNGGKRMTHDEAEGYLNAVSGAYENKGMNVKEWFCDGRFWDGRDHFDWLDSTTNDKSGTKTYRAFDASIASIEEATRDRDVRGILGFSQGCVWGSIITALARRGELPFGDSLGFGIYMSGFLPTFDEPSVDLWPIQGEFGSRFLIGEQDPLFPDGQGTLGPLAAKFPPQGRQTVVVPGLAHDVPRDPELTKQLVGFAASYL